LKKTPLGGGSSNLLSVKPKGEKEGVGGGKPRTTRREAWFIFWKKRYIRSGFLQKGRQKLQKRKKRAEGSFIPVQEGIDHQGEEGTAWS